MCDVAVLHLVWGPLGLDYPRRFVRSYVDMRADADHVLGVIFNGIARDQLDPFHAVFREVPHVALICDEPMQDLAAYRWATRRLTARFYCFINSYATLRADGWLRKLTRAASRDDAGLVGATGSFESLRARTRFDWPPLPLIKRAALRAAVARDDLRVARTFPRFPNPHVRTNGFVLRCDVLERLTWLEPRSRSASIELESGRRGLSGQARRLGLELLVVGADGRVFPPPAWPISCTYMSAAQENLLIADNRTRAYESADGAGRAALRQRAWGRLAEVDGRW